MEMICVFVYQKVGQLIIINWDVWECMGPEHNIDGME